MLCTAVAAAKRMAGPARRWCSSQLSAVRILNGHLTQLNYPVPSAAATQRHYSTHQGPCNKNGQGSAELLLACVQAELSMEQRLVEDMPPVTGFSTTVQGCVATLERHHGREMVKVQIDTKSALEVLPSDLEDEDEEDAFEPFFVPVFTVSVSNVKGDSLQFECSFDDQASYSNQGSEWNNLTIDSVSVIPADYTDPASVYSLATENLSAKFYDHLLEFLRERNVNEKFASEIIAFYKVYEHRCYLDQSLKSLKQFLQNI